MLPYSPAIRLKQGEYFAAAKIDQKIKKHMQPLFVVPPSKDNDPEKGAPLTSDEIAYFSAERIRKFWPFNPAFLDTQYVAFQLGDQGLRRLFSKAQIHNRNLVAVVPFNELGNPVYREFLRAESPRLAIHVRYEELDTSALVQGVIDMGCKTGDCLVFLDFTGTPFGIEGISSSVASIIDSVGMAALWSRIVFLGSAFPNKNPLKDSGKIVLPRSEWSTFKSALSETTVAPNLLGYGDFGADCGEMVFPLKAGGGAPIRHLRYTGLSDTLVIRGTDTGNQTSAMRAIAKDLIEDKIFNGRNFSYADELIWQIAKGIRGAGTATEWREINMGHHFTRVVRDLGSMSGVEFKDRIPDEFADQIDMFENVK